MNTMMAPDCADCPLLDRSITNTCPDDPATSEVPGRICVAFPQGENIFEEGAPIEGIHCLHSGQVALAKKQEDGDDDVWVVAVIAPGDVLGMPELLQEKIHRNGAIALQDTSACFIPREEALALLKKNPAIMFRIMRKVCERIRTMEHHLEEQANR